MKIRTAQAHQDIARLLKTRDSIESIACMERHRISFDGSHWWTRLGGIVNSANILRALRACDKCLACPRCGLGEGCGCNPDTTDVPTFCNH